MDVGLALFEEQAWLWLLPDDVEDQTGLQIAHRPVEPSPHCLQLMHNASANSIKGDITVWTNLILDVHMRLKLNR